MTNETLPTNQDSNDQEESTPAMMEPMEDEQEESTASMEDLLGDGQEDSGVSMADLLEGDEEDSSMSMMEQLEEYLSDGDYDYQPPKRGDLHTGVVIEIGDRGAIVDAGFKRDGIVPVSDLDRLDTETRESIRPGDEIAVTVDKPQDEEGRLLLSIYQALVREDWEKAEEMLAKGELYEGEISGYNRGGLLVPFGRIRGFIPASHTVGMPRGLEGDERRERLADMVGDKVGLKIIEVDPHRRRLILSQRQARRAWQRIQRKRVMEELTEGETAKGTVTGITDFGAFVDLGGADGLIHISELSWSQVDDPRQVVEVGDEVEVYVLNLDWERTRIALSLKRLNPNPWSQVAGHYEVGQLVEGKVSRVLDFGAFVELGLGVEGLLHISEMTGGSQVSPTEILENGQEVLVKIIGIDTRKQRITLSARQVQRDQWESWMAEHKIGQEEEPAEEPAEETAPALEVAAAEESEEIVPAETTDEEEARAAEALEEEAPEAAEETTTAEAVEEEAPEAETVEEEAPPSVDEEMPEAAEETITAEAVEEEAPEAEPVEDQAPSSVDEEAPEAVEDVPVAEGVEEEAPEAETVEDQAPSSVDEAAPEAVEDVPVAEGVEEESPEDETPPSVDEEVSETVDAEETEEQEPDEAAG